MADSGFGALASGFLQSFASARADKQKRMQGEEIKKVKLKIFKNKLEEEEKVKNSVQEFIKLFTGQQPGAGEALKPNIAGMGQSTEAFPQQKEPPKQGSRLLDLLTTPKGQRLSIESGMLTIPQLSKILKEKKLSDQLGNLGDTSGLNIDPVSALVAGSTGDIKQLKSGKTITKVVNTPDGPRLKVFTPDGRELSTLGRPKQKELSAEQAGKIAMLEQAVTDIDLGMDVLFPNGELDKSILFQMAAPFGGIGEGRKARSFFRNAINAKLRAETGAQANPDELDDMEKRFVPSPLDLTSEGLVELKISRLREFMEGALDITTLPESLRKKIEKRRAKQSVNIKEPTATNPQTGERVIFRDGKWQPL